MAPHGHLLGHNRRARIFLQHVLWQPKYTLYCGSVRSFHESDLVLVFGQDCHKDRRS